MVQVGCNSEFHAARQSSDTFGQWRLVGRSTVGCTAHDAPVPRSTVSCVVRRCRLGFERRGGLMLKERDPLALVFGRRY